MLRPKIIARSKINHSRVLSVTTAHGEILTPTFMPVGTKAFVNHVTPEELEHKIQSQIILGGNTFHMLLNPGLKTIEKLGGMHRLMHWSKSMLTDSGGFQLFSLAQYFNNNKKNNFKIDETGAKFKHPVTGEIFYLNPKTSIEAQKIIGADIIMAFDHCTPESGGREIAEKALHQTHRWLIESKNYHDKNSYSIYGDKQAFFGIIQGGTYPDLRALSTEKILAIEPDGIAIGGEIIGADIPKTLEVINWVRPLLPESYPRYTMGVGAQPQDLIDVIAQGIDLFDCVAPTRNGRHGALYHGDWVIENNYLKFISDYNKSQLFIKKNIYKNDDNKLMQSCDCYTCENFSRGYLHYLFKNQFSLYHHLATLHNLSIMEQTCVKIRALFI